MAYTVFGIEDFVYNAEEFANVGNTIRLRRVDINGHYDPNAELPAAGKVFSIATYTCPCADGTVGWRLVLPLAVRVYDEETGRVPQGTMKFQLYDGTNWYWYDTTAPAGWKTVSSPTTQWTSELNLITYFATYPGKLSRSIAVRCLIQPDSEGEYAPEPQALVISWTVSFAYDSTKDALEGLANFCSTSKVPLHTRTQLSAASATFTLSHDTTPITVAGGGTWRVYNLTTDPIRRYNLFSSWAAGTSVVTMSSSQSSGSIIETFFEAYIPAYLSADSTFYNSTTPSIVIKIDAQEDIDRQWSQQSHRHSLLNAGGLTYTNEHVPETLLIPVRFYCQASRHEEALDIANTILKRLQLNDIVSPGTNRPLIKIIPMRGLGQAIEIRKDLYVYTVPFKLVVKQWELTTNTILEYTLREIHLHLGNPDNFWELLTL